MRQVFSSLFVFTQLLVASASLSAQASAPAPARASVPVIPATQTFTSQDGRFSVLFAGQPTEKTQVIPLQGGGSTTLHIFLVELEDDNISYLVMYSDYSANYANGDPQSVLATTRDGAMRGRTLLTDTPTSLNGIPGRAFTAIDPKGIQFTVHQYLKGKRLYQLIVVSTAGHPATLTDLFLSSFQVW